VTNRAYGELGEAKFRKAEGFKELRRVEEETRSVTTQFRKTERGEEENG
jgi:hypothetical protein